MLKETQNWTAPEARQVRMSLRRRGFTILEIMIATAILTLGLVGILALFPVAIYSGKQIVERSSASVIADSVADAIREGLRTQLRFTSRDDAYFVFKHDGVKDPIPAFRTKEKASADYFVLLPKFKRRSFKGSRLREKALKAARTFVYPETDKRKNGGGRERAADNDGDDYRGTFSNGEAFEDILVEDTYKLGTFLPELDAQGENVLDDQKIDALKQYSYAFAITPSVKDANIARGSAGAEFQPAGRLYHVHVMVYRAFSKPAPGAVPEIPVFELDFEVSL